MHTVNVNILKTAAMVSMNDVVTNRLDQRDVDAMNLRLEGKIGPGAAGEVLGRNGLVMTEARIPGQKAVRWVLRHRKNPLPVRTHGIYRNKDDSFEIKPIRERPMSDKEWEVARRLYGEFTPELEVD